MDILTKKSKDNPNGVISSNKLLLNIEKEISSLKLQIEDLKKENSKLRESIKLTRTELIEILSDKIGVKFANINIAGTPTIEKNEDVKNGTLYYNTRKKCFRGKIDGKWITFKV